jgi:hypothetical protein
MTTKKTLSITKEAYKLVVENTPSFLVTNEMVTDKLIELVVEECIKAGRRCGGTLWTDLVLNADIEYNMKRQLGLVGNKRL